MILSRLPLFLCFYEVIGDSLEAPLPDPTVNARTCHLPTPSPCISYSVSCPNTAKLKYTSTTLSKRANDHTCSPITESKCSGGCCQAPDGTNSLLPYDWDVDGLCTGRRTCNGTNSFSERLIDYQIISHQFECLPDASFHNMKDRLENKTVPGEMILWFSHSENPAENWTCSCTLSKSIRILNFNSRMSNKSCQDVKIVADNSFILDCGLSDKTYVKGSPGRFSRMLVKIEFASFSSVGGDFLVLRIGGGGDQSTVQCTGCATSVPTLETTIASTTPNERNIITTTIASTTPNETNIITTTIASTTPSETNIITTPTPCLNSFDETTKDIILITTIAVLVITYIVTFIGFVWKFDIWKSIA